MNTIKPNTNIDINGTSLQGVVTCPYWMLVALFGEPETARDKIDDIKSDAEWTLETPLGVATIYNYKNGKNYMGDEGEAVEDITNWNIGAHTNSNAAEVVMAAIQGYKDGYGYPHGSN